MLHVFGANSISIEVYPDARINRLIVSQLLQSTVKLLHICLLKTVALNVVVATLTLQRSVLAELGLLLALYSFIRVCNEFFEPSAVAQSWLSSSHAEPQLTAADAATAPSGERSKRPGFSFERKKQTPLVYYTLSKRMRRG